MLVKALKPITKMIIPGSSSTKSKKPRYAVKVKGVEVSRHSTKALATKKAKSIKGRASVVALRGGR